MKLKEKKMLQNVKRSRWGSLISLTLLLSSCASMYKMTPMNKQEITKLTRCHTSLSRARKNLIGMGYEINKDKRDYFSTEFKKSEAESIKALAGNTLAEMHRKFIVQKFKKNSIKFKVIYKIVNFTSEGNMLGSEETNAGYFNENKQIHVNIKQEVCQ